MIVRALDLLHSKVLPIAVCKYTTCHGAIKAKTITPNYINSHFVITTLHLLKQQDDKASQLQQFISL